MELLKRLNWIDILVVAVAVRIIYSGITAGFVVEFMKALGTLAAVFFLLHYYTVWAGMLGHLIQAPMPVLEVIVFVAAWLILVLLAKLLCHGLLLVFTVQAIPVVDKWGAAVMAAARSFMVGSLLLFGFLLTDQPYMERITQASMSQKYVLSVAPKIYRRTLDGFVAKFFLDAKVNPAVSSELSEIVKK